MSSLPDNHPSSSSPTTSRKKLKMNENNIDFIDNLPDEILTIILSKLRIDEAIRCGVLSTSWLDLWEEVQHINFNTEHMVKPLMRLLSSRESRTIPDLSLSPAMQTGSHASGFTVFLLIHNHPGHITSCRFQHFKKSLIFGDLETWVDFLVETRKGLSDLSLECVPNNGESVEKPIKQEGVFKPAFATGVFNRLGSIELTNYTLDDWEPFKECNELKSLKLKQIYLEDGTLFGILDNCRVLENFSLLESTGFERVIVMKSKLKVLQLQALCVQEIEIAGENVEVVLLDSIICPASNVSICAPNLRDFRAYCSSMLMRMISAKEKKTITKASEILIRYCELLDPPTCNFLRNISWMSLDLDLNDHNEAMSLSYVMKLTPSLQALEIALPVFKSKDYGGSGSSNDSILNFSQSFYWQYRRLCDCTHYRLKFVKVKGFTGKEPEVQFATYLITKAPILETLIIICRDSTEKVAKKLFSLPKASPNLSMDLRFNAKNSMDEFAELQNRLLLK